MSPHFPVVVADDEGAQGSRLTPHPCDPPVAEGLCRGTQPWLGGCTLVPTTHPDPGSTPVLFGGLRHSSGDKERRATVSH